MRQNLSLITGDHENLWKFSLHTLWTTERLCCTWADGTRCKQKKATFMVNLEEWTLHVLSSCHINSYTFIVHTMALIQKMEIAWQPKKLAQLVMNNLRSMAKAYGACRVNFLEIGMLIRCGVLCSRVVEKISFNSYCRYTGPGFYKEELLHVFSWFETINWG